MTSKCPGQDFRNLRVSLHKCPNCGAEVEIFSDEIKIKCLKCGEMVYREKIPSCIDWCASARQCLGEERWKELGGGRLAGFILLRTIKEAGNDHHKNYKENHKNRRREV